MLGGVHDLLDTLFETVLMVANELSLVHAVTTFKPDPVIADLSLRREGDANVVWRFMGRHPNLHFIVHSVHDEPTVVRQLLSSGVVGFVVKRTAVTDLVPATKDVLRGRLYVSAAVQRDCHETGDPFPTPPYEGE
jgi:DNA-binding NarL/FixJ family response regulator